MELIKLHTKTSSKELVKIGSAILLTTYTTCVIYDCYRAGGNSSSSINTICNIIIPILTLSLFWMAYIYKHQKSEVTKHVGMLIMLMILPLSISSIIMHASIDIQLIHLFIKCLVIPLTVFIISFCTKEKVK